MEDFELTIALFAEADPEKEVCGVLIRDSSGLKAVPLANVSPDPSKSFLMRPSDYMPYLRDGSFEGYYHSHPFGDEKASEADRRAAESAGYPCHIYSLVTKKFSVYQPTGNPVPLTGRKFVAGELDCFTLVEDFFAQKFNLKFDPLVRTYGDMIDGVPNVAKIWTDRGFVIEDTPKPNDIICMAVGSKNGRCNHLGIYLDNQRMLHQPLNRVSEETVYGGYWQKHTLFYARYAKPL